MAFDRLEPFGGLQDDFRAGQIIAMLHNINRAEKSPPLSAADFMPSLRRVLDQAQANEPEIELTDEQRAAFLDAALFGVTNG